MAEIRIAGQAAAKPLEEQFVYDDIIAPMLERTCTNCHDEDKQKGKLRMDSHAALMAGGQEGPAIEPGSAEKSNIIVRIRLPEDDDEHMPPEGKPDLTDEEIRRVGMVVGRGCAGGREGG